MSYPTYTKDYIGRTYNYTHPKTGHHLSITVTSEMVGRPLDDILDEADRNRNRLSRFIYWFKSKF